MPTIYHPDVLNALRPGTHLQLVDAWRHAASAEVKAVIVTGAGRGFCAGMDLNTPLDESLTRSKRLRSIYHPHVEALIDLDEPVVAAVNGAAVGAGLALAAAADVRVVSTSAVFVPGFRAIGLAPDDGASWFLPRILGYGRAARWLTTGSKISADVAQQWGLADEVVAPDSLVSTAKAIALSVSNAPGQSTALTLSLLRRASWGEDYKHSLKRQPDLEAGTIEVPAVAPGRAEALKRMRSQLKR